MQSVVRLLSRWSPTLAASALSAAEAAFHQGDYAKAFSGFHALAEDGSAVAQLRLGLMYRNGDGATANSEEAARWIRLAAEQGIADAQFGLGVMIQNGDGVLRDPVEAAHWYSLAAQRGCATAQINLACCFHDGDGVPNDEAKAAWWIRMAAEQGAPDAQMNLGVRYLNGIGVSKDDAQALYWFNLASANGHAEAVKHRDTIAQNVTSDQATEAQCRAQEWQPVAPADSALEVFRSALAQCYGAIREGLGEERVLALRATDLKFPDVGRTVLEESSGVRPATIAKRLQNRLLELAREIARKADAAVGTESRGIGDFSLKETIGFLHSFEDLMDAGVILGAPAEDRVQNLRGMHHAFLREIEGSVNRDLLALLIKHHSLREALRAPGLRPWAGACELIISPV